ncbi:Transcriptional regulator TetR family [Patulibacter medicamentivorans]|uniref:Transcriptional regulator TetR family n=1 Tax=Patulibacter medicamentivorans TaxID=1097667 RepID=H0EAV1_9ACTN|nr:TetR/AcrR family transcriptional regulator [Patulibacter medicamentivorans]EHN09169.1 Transcriptional regulator TetR family [Patulibacter medicamentivorans]
MKQRTTPADPIAAARTADQRRRLLRGIATAVDEKGFAATTIADIVGHARVSKRTFYEHFDDKLDCFLASYRAGSALLLRRMAAGAEGDGPWPQRMQAAIRAYLGVLADTPAVTRTFAIEIQAAGPEALELRREMHRRSAEQLRTLVDEVRREHPELRPLSPAMAAAIVGAMTELIVVALADRGDETLRDLDREIVFLLHAVLTAPELPEEVGAPHPQTTDPEGPMP